MLIAGIGQTPVGEHWETSLRSLAVQAIRLALQDAGGLHPSALFAANALAPNISRQAHLGTLLADYAGLEGIEAVAIEAGCASGGAALRQAWLAIRSGLVDVALVVGVEKFTDSLGTEQEAARATLTDSETEAVFGMTPNAQAALLARRYLHEFSVPADGLAGFALTARANAAGNKAALNGNHLSLEEYRQAEKVHDPLTVYDLAQSKDGAACLVLAHRSALPKTFQHPLVQVTASAAVSDALALHDRLDPLSFEAARQSSASVLKKAGIACEQIDLFEYSDLSSIHAALSLEAAGFAGRGEGWKLAADGSIALTGQIPCATLGGSLGRGDPTGATGLYQGVEAVLQLRGSAGKNQITGARRAMIQSLAGPAALAVTHILERLD